MTGPQSFREDAVPAVATASSGEAVRSVLASAPDGPDRAHSEDSDFGAAPMARTELLLTRLRYLAGVTAVLAVGLLFPIPLHGAFWNAAFDLAHAPAFFAGLLLFIGIADPRAVMPSSRRRPVWELSIAEYLIVAGFLWGAGVVAEILQRLVGRSSSLGDVLANSCGILAGLCWIFSVRVRVPLLKYSLWLLGLVCLVLPARKPIGEMLEWYRVQQDFPVISSFERPQELSHWQVHTGQIELSDEWASEGRQSLKVVLESGFWPGVFYDRPPEDWSQFDTLAFDLYNPEAESLELLLKVCDRIHIETGCDPSDRFEVVFPVPPGEERTIRVPFAEIIAGPTDRETHMDAISFLQLFRPSHEGPTTFYADHFRLERHGDRMK